MDHIIGSIAGRVFAALGLIAVAALFWQWYSADRIATTFSHLTQVSNTLWPNYRNQPTRYGTAAIPANTIIRLRALPDNAICATNLCNEFGGTWSFTGSTNILLASIDNVGDTDCTRLVNQVPRSSGVTQVRVGATIAGAAAATANPAPVNPDTAASLCVNGTNAIQFAVSRVD